MTVISAANLHQLIQVKQFSVTLRKNVHLLMINVGKLSLGSLPRKNVIYRLPNRARSDPIYVKPKVNNDQYQLTPPHISADF